LSKSNLELIKQKHPTAKNPPKIKPPKNKKTQTPQKNKKTKSKK
jgi:hypothetical protein